jgi:hypothetical protein
MICIEEHCRNLDYGDGGLFMIQLCIRIVNEKETKYVDITTNSFIVPHIGEKLSMFSTEGSIRGLITDIKHDLNLLCSDKMTHMVKIIVNENDGE